MRTQNTYIPFLLMSACGILSSPLPSSPSSLLPRNPSPGVGFSRDSSTSDSTPGGFATSNNPNANLGALSSSNAPSSLSSGASSPAAGSSASTINRAHNYQYKPYALEWAHKAYQLTPTQLDTMLDQIKTAVAKKDPNAEIPSSITESLPDVDGDSMGDKGSFWFSARVDRGQSFTWRDLGNAVDAMEQREMYSTQAVKPTGQEVAQISISNDFEDHYPSDRVPAVKGASATGGGASGSGANDLDNPWHPVWGAN